MYLAGQDYTGPEFGPHHAAFLEKLEKHIKELTGEPFWLKFKKVRDNAKIPTRAYNSLGYDLYPCQAGTIFMGQTERIPLGISSSFSPTHFGMIEDRSSTGSRNLKHLAGQIDADYRGEWQLVIHNLDAENGSAFDYSPEKPIAQVFFLKADGVFEPTELLDGQDHDESERGERGFGSSDK